MPVPTTTSNERSRMPYVNHYSFHILDPDWGHITIKISGHPPFPAQVILNGHEYVACQARKAGIGFTKEGNCFTHISDAAGLAKIADTLSGPADYRAAEPSLRALDLYHLLVLRARPGGTGAERVSLPVLELSDRVQPQPDFRDRRPHGAGLSGVDRSQPRAAELETVKTILGYQRRPRYRISEKRGRPNGRSRSRDLRMI